MTLPITEVRSHQAISAADGPEKVDLEQRVNAAARATDAGQPALSGGDEPDNLALCYEYITKQIMMDMVSRDEDEEEWKEKWF